MQTAASRAAQQVNQQQTRLLLSENQMGMVMLDTLY